MVLCRFGISNDSEHDDYNIHQIVINAIGDKLGWFDRNYPQLSIMRRTTYDAAPDQMVYEYYVDFPDMESLTHYTLTHGYEDMTK
jgi:hypothetical protein